MAAKNQDASVAGTAWYEISMIGNGQQPAKKLVKVNRWTKAVVSALLAASSKNDSQASSQASEDGDSPVQTAKLEKLKALMAQPRTKRLVVVCPDTTNYGKGLEAFLDEHFEKDCGYVDCAVKVRGRIRKEGYKFRDNSTDFKIDDIDEIDDQCFPAFAPDEVTNGQPDILCDQKDWEYYIRKSIAWDDRVEAYIEDFDSAWAPFTSGLDGDDFHEWIEKEPASKSDDSEPSDSGAADDSEAGDSKSDGNTTADDSVQAKPSKTKHPDSRTDPTSPTSPTSPVASMPDDDQHLHKIMRKTC
jgi:hypothetical protein